MSGHEDGSCWVSVSVFLLQIEGGTFPHLPLLLPCFQFVQVFLESLSILPGCNVGIQEGVVGEKSDSYIYTFSEVVDIHSRNKVGPKTDPCGTPARTGPMQDFSPSTTTCWMRSDRKLAIHCLVFQRMLSIQALTPSMPVVVAVSDILCARENLSIIG